ncbi:MAG: ABC transporter permease [Synergistaceae bacterium]|nr:ABC transporter permease [Synergistaceae bacterium]
MTNRRMFFKMLVSSLVRRRSRLLAALCAVAIGGTVLLGMASISYDIPRQMGREFRSYGANMVLVASGEEALLGLEDAEKAASVIPPASLVGMTPYRYEMVRVNMQGYTAVGTVFESARKTSPYWSVTGEWPAGSDDILIGSDIAEFTGLARGSSITITGRASDGSRFSRDVTVSGVIRSGSVEDGFIIMSLPALEALMGNSGVADMAELSIAGTETELGEIASSIRAGVPNVSPRLVKRVTQSEAAVLSKLQALVVIVSAVVLVLTMICVATTMMTVVMERRREIGLKKAIGAENRSIAKEFLGEGVLLGFLGGVLGAVFGYVFAQTVCVNVFGRGIILDWKLLPLTIAVSIAVTVCACLLPVRRAVEVEPALVLRGE